MTRRLLIGALLLVGCGWGDGPPERTGGQNNGRVWRQWNKNEKLFFAAGFSDALTSLGGFLVIPPDVANGQPLIDPKCQSCYFFPSGYTYNEIIGMIDTFFATPENRTLPIGDAIAVLAMRRNGMAREQVDKEIEYLRRAALIGK